MDKKISMIVNTKTSTYRICVCPYSWIYHVFFWGYYVSDSTLHTSPIGTGAGKWQTNGAVHNECLLGKHGTHCWTRAHSTLIGCKKSSSVRCGCNSVHISLASFQTGGWPATLKFLSGDSKVWHRSAVESMAASTVGGNKRVSQRLRSIGGAHFKERHVWWEPDAAFKASVNQQTESAAIKIGTAVHWRHLKKIKRWKVLLLLLSPWV